MSYPVFETAERLGYTAFRRAVGRKDATCVQSRHCQFVAGDLAQMLAVASAEDRVSFTLLDTPSDPNKAELCLVAWE